MAKIARQREVISSQFVVEKRPAEIRKFLLKVYGATATSLQTICRWCDHFEKGSADIDINDGTTLLSIKTMRGMFVS